MEFEVSVITPVTPGRELDDPVNMLGEKRIQVRRRSDPWPTELSIHETNNLIARLSRAVVEAQK